MTTPSRRDAGEKPALLNLTLRVMAPDGHLYEIDGNKDMSIAVYEAELGERRGEKNSDRQDTQKRDH